MQKQLVRVRGLQRAIDRVSHPLVRSREPSAPACRSNATSTPTQAALFLFCHHGLHGSRHGQSFGEARGMQGGDRAQYRRLTVQCNLSCMRPATSVGHHELGEASFLNGMTCARRDCRGAGKRRSQGKMLHRHCCDLGDCRVRYTEG